MNETLFCSRCKQELPVEMFHKMSTVKRGYNTICKSCKSYSRDILTEILSNCKSRAKKRGFNFDLTREFLIELNVKQGNKCVYSGIELNWDIEPSGRSRVCPPNRVSVDRIDSSKGYTQDNVQLVTDFVNRIKSFSPESDLYYFCKSIVDNIEGN